VYVPADDGVRLATDVYLPDGAGPWPVVLTRTPYNRRDPGHYDDWCRTLAGHGYACVVQDCRGRFGSWGSDTVFRDDGRDGRATVAWIADQDWCDGSIASVGGSAMGLTGYAMAPGAPEELTCMVAAVATPDVYHDIFSVGGVAHWELAYYWLESQGSLPALEEFFDHRLLDEWWEDYAWLAAPGTVNTATLHFGGWWDLYTQGTLDAFERYQHAGGEGARGRQHLVIGPWHHHTLNADWLAHPLVGTRTTGELRFPDNAFPGGWPLGDSTWQMLLDWLDACLRNDPSPAASWPPARVYLMGAVGEPAAPGNRWVDLDDWPPGSVAMRYFLTADGGLDPISPDPGQRTLVIDPLAPVPTLGGANLFADIEVDGRPMGTGSYDQRPVEARNDVLTFTSEPLTEPLTVIGRVRCRVWLTPDTPDLDLSVRLTDVYPDGRSMLLMEGIQRARMRCGDDRECLLVPGQPTEIEVDLWSTAMVFNAGHRLRVAVAGSNWPRFEVNPNDGGDPRTGTPIPARPVVLTGGEHASVLELPVVPSPRQGGGRRTPG